MSEFLVIRLAEERPQAAWLVMSEQGHRLSHTMSGPLPAAAAECRGREVLLLVPGVDSLTTRVKLPVKRQARIQQMLPYTLEDSVVEDVDSLLFAAGPRREDGTIPVAIVARELVHDWAALCAEAGITVDAIFVDAQGVPETPGSLTLLLEGHRIYGRLPDREPFVFEDLSLQELMEILASDADARAPFPLSNIVIYADDGGYRYFKNDLGRVRERASSVEVSVLPDGALPRLAATLITRSGSNLLQGPFRLRSNWNELVRPWRLPATLAIALVLTVTVGQAARYFFLSRDEQALTELLESNCQAAFSTTSLSACEAQIRDRLAIAGSETTAGGDAFLDTLISVAGARDDRMQIQALTFRNGVTSLRVMAPDVQALDSLAQSLGNGGRFQADIQSAVPGDEGIEGRLQIAELRR